MAQEMGPLTQWMTRTGRDPDPRFTLANERTFLSWIRTSIALIGAGVAVDAFGLEIASPGGTRVAALSLVLAGMVLSLGAALRWVKVEHALRAGRTLPAPAMVPLIVTMLTLGGLVMLWFTAAGR